MLDQDFTYEEIKENLDDEIFAEDYAEGFEEGLEALIKETEKLLKANHVREKNIKKLIAEMDRIGA